MAPVAAIDELSCEKTSDDVCNSFWSRWISGLKAAGPDRHWIASLPTAWLKTVLELLSAPGITWVPCGPGGKSERSIMQVLRSYGHPCLLSTVAFNAELDAARAWIFEARADIAFGLRRQLS